MGFGGIYYCFFLGGGGGGWRGPRVAGVFWAGAAGALKLKILEAAVGSCVPCSRLIVRSAADLTCILGRSHPSRQGNLQERKRDILLFVLGTLHLSSGLRLKLAHLMVSFWDLETSSIVRLFF